MPSGILIAQLAGTTLADDDGICQSQSIVAGDLTMNGSLLSGGVWENLGYGYKPKIVASGDASGVTFTLSGKFYASASVGEYTTTLAVTGPNATSATAGSYAVRIDGVSVDSGAAGVVTVGLSGTSLGAPVNLPYSSLWQFRQGRTFGGASVAVDLYDADIGAWIGVVAATAAAGLTNVELPANTVVRPTLTDASTTTALTVVALPIQKTI